ncbi:MAG TPA: hypothetical protein VMT85_01720 [Thermoanaerobaculia bacterium]|nr:hypothetical protein [Thermoanaerobaculia bacterium]
MDARAERQLVRPALHPEPADRVNEVERGAHRPLRVVLLGDRRAPDRHDGVADELLDAPAVALDDLAGGLEIMGQQVAHVLGVPLLRQRREADEVGEEHADQASLGGGQCRRRHGRGGRLGQRGAAVAAELRAWRVRGAAARAGDGQPLPALAAELAASFVR